MLFNFRASFKLPVNHLLALRRVIEMDDKNKDEPNNAGALGCRDFVWALQHFSASIGEVKRHVEGEVIDDNFAVESGDFFPSLDEMKGMAQYFAWAATILAGAFGKYIVLKPVTFNRRFSFWQHLAGMIANLSLCSQVCL